MAIVIDEYTLIGIVFALAVVSKIVNSQGGATIVMWRIRGVRWFLHTQIGPDGNTIRKPLKMSRVQSHSVPMYEYQGKAWFTGGPDETARLFGGPQWVYRYNDARPLPLRHTETKQVEVEEEVVSPDGSKTTRKTMKPVVVAGKPIDPMLIHAGFENKSIEAFNKLSDKPKRFTWGIFGLVMAVILILSIFSLIYTWYYGVNIACAVHAHGVNCG